MSNVIRLPRRDTTPMSVSDRWATLVVTILAFAAAVVFVLAYLAFDVDGLAAEATLFVGFVALVANFLFVAGVGVASLRSDFAQFRAGR